MSQARSHELTFCADAKAWMEQELATRPELVFGKVRIEESPEGSAKRFDLAIYDRQDKIVITGEVKLPSWKNDRSTSSSCACWKPPWQIIPSSPS